MIGEAAASWPKRRAGLAIVAGVALAIGARVLFGSPSPVVTIVWDESAGTGARRYLERRFSLTDQHSGRAGLSRYALRDTSEANRRAMLAEERIRGIEGIDRRTFDVSPLLPRAAWRAGVVRAPEAVAAAVEILGVLLAAGGVAALLLPPSAATSLRRWSSRGLSWMQRGVPAATPEAAAAFRIVFGSLVVWFFYDEPVRVDQLTAFAVAQSEGLYGTVVRWLAAHPGIVVALRPVLLWTGVLFVLGVATRVAFAAFTLAALLWACVFTLSTTAHAIAALQVSLIALLASRWGDAWSVDALLRNLRGRPRTSTPLRAYGYSVWIPGFVLAVAFVAAAWSKVRQGPGWILNGTVKYHFVSDLEQAWVTWGPSLTRWHVVAVLMSAAAVIIEALVITGVFSTRYAYRAVLGCCAAGLLVGFALFQGIVWPAWWVLLLSFLPWHLIGGASTRLEEAQSRQLSVAQVTVILVVIGQQLLVTVQHMEARPLLSSYDMYSATYATPEDYEAASNLVYRVVDVSDGDAVDLPGCVVDDHVAAIARRGIGGNSDDLALLKHAIGGCVRERPEVRRVALEGDRQVFVWDEGRFDWKRWLDVVGPFDASLLRD
jgi:hypothetical protein